MVASDGMIPNVLQYQSRNESGSYATLVTKQFQTL